MDELVVEGRIYTSRGFLECSIGVTEGRITRVKKILRGEEKERFPHSIILPAGIDIHVHFREPGYTYKEDFATGSVAAAYGGISCVFDMPNTNPPVTTANRLLEKKERVSRHSYIDFGLYSGVTKRNIAFLSRLAKLCSGFKIYLGETTSSTYLPMNLLDKVMMKLKDTGKPILFHAEDEECLERNNRVERNLRDHLRARPLACEVKAVEGILKHGGGVQHICHVSSYEALKILETKSDISYGVTPHHALLNIDTPPKIESLFKTNPPIRGKMEQSKVFETLLRGRRGILESDHAPHLIDEKKTVFNDAPSGVPGVETMYPLFLYLARRNVIPYHRVIKLLCENPGELMGVSKGKIIEGFDADFIVVDYRDVKEVTIDILHSKCDWTPFEGFQAIFPTHLFLRGEPVIYDGELVGFPGMGRYVEDFKSK